jgi:hypothetical protein
VCAQDLFVCVIALRKLKCRTINSNIKYFAILDYDELQPFAFASDSMSLLLIMNIPLSNASSLTLPFLGLFDGEWAHRDLDKNSFESQYFWVIYIY